MIKKHCKTCKKEFDAIKEAQFFCTRKCFKRDYYKRDKARKAIMANTRPFYTCGSCGHSEVMPFDPVKNYAEFNEYKCPKCKIPRRDLISREDSMTMLIG